MPVIRHLENRHDVIFSAEGGPFWIKFRRLVQNDMSTAVIVVEIETRCRIPICLLRPAESQRGPRGRPLSGPLHIPPPFPFPSLSSPFPLPLHPLPRRKAAPSKTGVRGFLPRENYFET